MCRAPGQHAHTFAQLLLTLMKYSEIRGITLSHSGGKHSFPVSSPLPKTTQHGSDGIGLQSLQPAMLQVSLGNNKHGVARKVSVREAPQCALGCTTAIPSVHSGTGVRGRPQCKPEERSPRGLTPPLFFKWEWSP